MVLPLLQPELWTYIFGFLKREVPPPWIPATWSEFHQEDLVSVCGVSVAFHNLAAPLLYHSAVACSLPILLNGLEVYGHHRLPSLSKKITAKDELVARTRSLRIVGLGPSCRPPLKIKPILQHGDWGAIGLTGHERSARAQKKAVEELKELAVSQSTIIALARNPPFTALETAVLGQRYDCGWEHLKRNDGNLLQAAHNRVAVFFTVHRLKSICTHSTTGPYALDGSFYGPLPSCTLIRGKHIGRAGSKRQLRCVSQPSTPAPESNAQSRG